MAKATKVTYSGPAKITDVTVYDFDGTSNRIWKKWEIAAISALSERDRNDAMKIGFSFAADSVEGEIVLPYYKEQLKGDAITWFAREDGMIPTRIDETNSTLARQHLCKDKSIESLAEVIFGDAAIGKIVKVEVGEELGNDGSTWWHYERFVNSNAHKLSADDKAARLAAFLAGKPAPKPTANAATKPAPLPPAPAEDESNPEDIPF